MIITKNLNIKVNASSINYYKKLGYVIKMYDFITIPIENLTKGSKYLIKIKCDNCNNEKEIQYKTYIKLTKDLTDKYYCRKCQNIRYKSTCLEKYGVDNISKSKNIKNKIKQTKFEKYGSENYNNIEKNKQTCSEKYGCDSVFQNENVKDKIKETNLEKYGCENPNQNKDIRNKTKQTCINKYGVEYSLQNKEVRNNIKTTNLKKYGVECTLNSEEIKLKIKESRILNGNQIPDCQLTDFQKYYKDVKTETRKHKKILFKNWNGFDYYDKEYIKENMNLLSKDILYPTIDHKISIFYGFFNNFKSDEIGNLSNLCITKREINSSKNKKTENQYYDSLKKI